MSFLRARMFANKREYGLRNGIRRIRSPTTHGIDQIMGTRGTHKHIGDSRSDQSKLSFGVVLLVF